MHALPIDSGDVGEIRDTGAVQGRPGEKLLRHAAALVSEQQRRTRVRTGRSQVDKQVDSDGNKTQMFRPRPRPLKEQLAVA